MMNPSDEWELSKENVQPLKHGRKVTSLTAALQPHNVDQHQQLILQRQAKEAALRSYTGDDPLQPWHEYIRWTEQAYPNGGKDSNLQPLLEKCLSKFKDEARYKNDARYVSCWIKLANCFLNNPLEIFQFMRDQGIGTELSIFYEAWSWELEQLGNTKKADAVYREGLACRAQPKDMLEMAHREFQSRVARATVNQIQEGSDASGTQMEQREHLGELKGKGRHQKVSSQRVGAAKHVNKGGLNIAPSTQQVGQSFSVYCDSEASQAASRPIQSSLPAPTGEWERIPVQGETQKENVREAGPWAGQKVRQHRTATGGIGVSQLATFAQPSFKVHVDETGPEITTPQRMPEMGSQVLSARKPEKPTNLLQNIAQQPVTDDKTKAMYCKHLIYNGANEMSFEELRAIKYNARREAKKLEEERAALERQRVEYQALVRQQQEAMEQQLQQQRLMHQQHMEEQKRATQQMQQQLQQLMQYRLQPQATVPSQQVPNQGQHPGQMEQSEPLSHDGGALLSCSRKPDSEPRDPTVTRQLMYEETGNHAWMLAGDTSASCQPIPSSSQADGHHRSTGKITPGSTATGAVAAPNVSQTPTPIERGAPTPGSAHSRNTSGLGLSRMMTPSHTPGALTRPSPTVHTKEAISVVMAMLNNPLGDDDDFGWGAGQQLPPAQRDNDFEANFANADSQKCQPQAFPDFQGPASDTSEFTSASKGTTAGPAFTIFNEAEVLCAGGRQASLDEYDHLDNQENIPPKDFVKPKPDGRQKLGVLRPAQGIPFIPLEEQERAAREEEERSPPEENDDIMEGIQPLPVGESSGPSEVTAQQAINETILDHQAGRSAFKAHSRMASTPFTSLGVLSFPPLSSIKPSLLLGAEVEDSTLLQDSTARAGSGRPVTLPTRVMMTNSLESFEATECTINADSQQKLSPIMERSNEDARSSASSSTNSTGSSHLSSTTHTGLSSVSHAGLLSTTRADRTSISSSHPPSAGLSAPSPSCFTFPTANDGSLSTRNAISHGVHLDGSDNLSTGHQASTISQDPSVTSKPDSPASLRDGTSIAPSSCLSTDSGQFGVSNALLSTTQSGSLASSASIQSLPRNGRSLASPPSTSLQALDMSHVSVRRGLGNHRTRVGSHGVFDTYSSNSLQVNESFGEFNLSANGRNGSNVVRASDHYVGFNPDHLHGNKSQSFRIFNESADCKPSAPATTGGSFKVFKDKPVETSAASMRAVSQPVQSSTGQHSNLNRGLTSATYSSQSMFENKRPPLEKLSDKVQGTSPLEGRGKPYLEPSNSHQSFQIFDENMGTHAPFTDQGTMQSFQSSMNEFIREQVSAPVNHDQQPPKWEESLAKESSAPDVSLHLSTSLMAKMHLGEPEDSFTNASLQRDASLMDCSEVPDEQSACARAPAVDSEDIDPFSEVLKGHLLSNLPRHLSDYEGYSEWDYPMPELVPSETVGLSDEWYTVEKLIGEGAFAKVYRASILCLHTDDYRKVPEGADDKMVLKVQKPACPWEFYISRTLHERLASLGNPMDVRASVMYASNMHVFPDGSCLVMKHHHLTLLDAVNAYNRSQTVMPEPLLLLFTIEILHVVEQMHACGIVHGDIKPDNFLLILDDDDNDNTDEIAANGTLTNTKHIKLIDFGRSIDMRLFPLGMTFRTACGTDGFMCPEMLKGQPWTYQTDLFGVAATVHCLMFGTYMSIYNEKERWRHTSNIKRYYDVIWKEFFDSLLNIPSCDALPSLGELRRGLEESLARKPNINLDNKINKLASLLTTK
ncbi:uncharacterized protein LOC110979487 isoform X2 [Acanthaster planci]|uniref:Uncharacterized protein LOC110979487 isoform X2 n=1 Tax=Acanthaster planci TaxID=133434 RepID=A0A8B7YF44_ACAPL|nr:uncharacterized protein LOC110979487 isoform X2 [Acanthaster planci]